VLSLSDLRARRAHDCRLTKDRALNTLDDADAFLNDRGMLTLTTDSTLPSLFGACHEEPYLPGKSGFGSWPKTKWKWGGQLAEREGVYLVKIHKGKLLYLSADAASVADPLCREALDDATDGAYGPEAAALVRHLKTTGPSLLEDVRGELDLEPKALRSARDKLEKVGALVAKSAVRPAEEKSHLHTSVLYRWDQLFTARRKAPPPAALEELIVLGVRASVVAQEDDARGWFSWPVTRGSIERLLAQKRLARPAAGWLSAP
jgi:hypothetical protein